MTQTMEQKETLATMLISQWEQAGAKLMAMAEKFPENKYESAPVDGVRSFGDVLRHVAFWNHYVAGSARGKKTDDTANELPKTQYPTKKQILHALKQSMAESHAALSEQTTMKPETAEMVVSFIGHTSEHYGQLVVYMRLNGIVPPSSAA